MGEKLINNVYKKVSIGLISSMIGIYLLSYLPLFKFIDATLLNYWIIPGLWMGILLLMYQWLPHIHGGAKLRFRNHIYIWAFNCGVAFIIINMLAGVIEGFGKSPYSHSFKSIAMNFVFVAPALIGREHIRAYVVNTFAKRRQTILYLSIGFMTLMSINVFKLNSIDNLKGLTIFLSEQLLPEVCVNTLATYLVFYGGPIASIIYIGMIEAFEWLSPILPDLDWLAKSVIGIGVPLVAVMIVSSSYMKLAKVEKSYRTKEESIWQWLPTAIGCVLLIWFTVGVFPIYPSAIATGSMEPVIYPGDVVLVDKITDMEELEALKVGDVIQFTRGDILINHRIIEIVEQDEQKVYRTKGDNNSTEDRELVKMEDIKGTIVQVIPKIGWPTLIFKSDNPDVLDEIEF